MICILARSEKKLGKYLMESICWMEIMKEKLKNFWPTKKILNSIQTNGWCRGALTVWGGAAVCVGGRSIEQAGSSLLF